MCHFQPEVVKTSCPTLQSPNLTLSLENRQNISDIIGWWNFSHPELLKHLVENSCFRETVTYSWLWMSKQQNCWVKPLRLECVLWLPGWHSSGLQNSVRQSVLWDYSIRTSVYISFDVINKKQMKLYECIQIDNSILNKADDCVSHLVIRRYPREKWESTTCRSLQWFPDSFFCFQK